MYTVTLWRVRVTTVAVERNIHYIFRVCVCILALVISIQSACAVLHRQVACLAVPYCPHYLIKYMIFWKKKSH
jgi:hypothetical protein